MDKEDLIKWINKYLTERFIAPSDTLPKDECQKEAEAILDKVLKGNWVDKPDSEEWWWFAKRKGGYGDWVIDGCYELKESRDGFFCELGYISGWSGKWSKAIVPEKE